MSIVVAVLLVVALIFHQKVTVKQERMERARAFDDELDRRMDPVSDALNAAHGILEELRAAKAQAAKWEAWPGSDEEALADRAFKAMQALVEATGALQEVANNPWSGGAVLRDPARRLIEEAKGVIAGIKDMIPKSISEFS